MSDIGFLLLIFIMLISLMNQRHEEKIEYSESRLIEKTQEEHNLEIWILKNGGVFVNGLHVTNQELEMQIVQTILDFPQTRIHIIADKNTPYRHIDETIKILQRLQHRIVSFVVKEAY